MQAENVLSQCYIIDNWSTSASVSSAKQHSTVGAELYGYKHEEAKPTGSSRIKRTTRVIEVANTTLIIQTLHQLKNKWKRIVGQVSKKNTLSYVYSDDSDSEKEMKKAMKKAKREKAEGMKAMKEVSYFEARIFVSESGVRAYYRVVAKKRDGYVMAAAMSMFTVITAGTSDLLKLTIGREPVTNDVFQTTVDQECGWMASRITVLPRSILKGVTLSVLNAKDETGDAFLPEKIVEFFCQDFNPEHKNELIALRSKIHQEPNPLGTIFEVRTSPKLKEIIEIGVEAFKKTSVHDTPAGDIVETCVLMGYSAANALSFGRLDTRSFPIQDGKRVGRLLNFNIVNPSEMPTEGKWSVGNRISVHGAAGGAHAVLETLLAVKNALKITARLSQGAPNHITFADGLYLVSQMEPEGRPILRDGFFNQIPEESHGRRILETLYGGEKLPKHAVAGKTFCYPVKKPVELNVFQSEYVEMLQDRENHPIIVGSSSFDCGKSMKIVTAAVELAKIVPSSQKQLLITQSNFASEVAKECLTDYDLPVLQKKIFTEWAEGKYQRKSSSFFRKPKSWKPQSVKPYALLEPFMILYRPNVIMVTAASIHNLLQSSLLKKDEVSTIQIDEASQLPEYSFVSLLTLFPHANFGLIGGIQQLPLYCEIGLEGKLKDYGIDNTMERAVTRNLFPQAMLREVYRCHPKTTDLLTTWSAQKLYGRKTRLLEKSKIPGDDCQQSKENPKDRNLLWEHRRERSCPESDNGVISFYRRQNFVLIDTFRGRDVKCGTVDAFQRTEREVIILCCKNEMIE
ncbi:hypothetical protein CAEBREN_10508 [Caenorhabditis brenneri]|uniref:DNA2/NAM7 helicase-like C-terminal domain-containing protein n=1 Tax=Caenorhabditis brenneri TaxID=135651 RepID=G0ND38_CAEBE|nr:hypothetical protein CAEBREN_10508 [Caenorhabditis brenneri]